MIWFVFNILQALLQFVFEVIDSTGIVKIQMIFSKICRRLIDTKKILMQYSNNLSSTG